jgi:DNA polymerase
MDTVVVNKYKEDFDVYIGRGSKWGNPFVIGPDGDREEVIHKYEVWIRAQPHLMNSLHELENKRLGCFCKPKMCHGDILVKLLGERMSKKEELQKLAEEISICKKCSLCNGRTKTVPGEGNENTDILFLGEAPGFEEDQQGKPFVGRSGKLLSLIMQKELNVSRSDVFIVNICKCRPPNNRPPLPEEVAQCLPYLIKQIDIIKPKIIITLGRTALQSLFNGTEIKMGEARGHWRKYGEIPVMPIYHPAFLLRGMTDAKKNAVKFDLKKVVEKINELKSDNLTV